MAPTIHLVRHAQGYHNLCVENESIRDPDLTPLGHTQCVDLRASFPDQSKITQLIASPMRRTLDTCIRTFGREDLYPIVALDCLQEAADVPSDTGSDVEALRAAYGAKVDLSRVRAEWTDKSRGSRFAPEMDKLMARGLEARRAIREIAGDGEGHVVVVLHGAFMHFLTDDWQGLPEQQSTTWHNCEYRTYQFSDESGQDADAALAETPASYRRRLGHDTYPTPVQQSEWRTQVHERIAPLLMAKA